MSANTYAVVVGSAVFFFLLFLAAGVMLIYNSSGEQRLRRRLEGGDVAVSDDLSDNASGPILQEIARRGRAIDKAVDSEGETARLMVQAGWRDTQSRLGYYVLQVAMPFLGGGLVIAGWIFGKGKFFQPPLVYLLFCMSVVLFLLIPRMILRSIAGARRQRIRKEVPLFVHLLVMLYDAGLSTRQAFTNMVREGAGVLPELGGEIQLVLRQIEAGGDSSEVLQSLSDTLDVADLTSIIGVMRQVDRYGGEIREPLHDALKVVEERQVLDLRERVNIISGRMTMVMVTFFFPALLLFVAGPAFVSLIKAIRTL
jgi:tight adherence protein C